MEKLYERSFILAVFAQFGFVVSNMLVTHYARWIRFLGGDVELLGKITGCAAVGALLARPWLGGCIDRVGARNTWLLGLGVFGLGALGSLLLRDLGLAVYLLRGCLFFGAACVFSSSLTYVSQTAPASRRTEAIGILGVGGFVGMLTGPYFGDLILGSEERGREEFVVLFAVAAAVLVVPAVLVCSLPPRPPGERHPLRARTFFRLVLQHWPGTIAAVDLTFGLCMTVPLVFLPDYVDTQGLSRPGFSAIGWFFVGYAGWGLVLRVWSRRIPDRWGRGRVLIAGILCMGGGMFCYLLVSPSTPGLLIVPGLACGTGHALMYHTMTSLTLDPFPDAVRGTGSTLALLLLDLGFVAGAPLFGFIAERFGYEYLFVTAGTTCFLVALLFFASRRRT